MKKRLMIVLLCLLLAVSACGKTEIRPAEDAPASTEGKSLSFETRDLDGNAVSSEELFSAHKITMVNVMTTWCTYCIQELPELQSLSEAYAEKDCAIVGLLYDGTDTALLDTGRSLMEQAGAGYLVLQPWDGMDTQIPVQAFPTTFFVNSDGEIVGETILGAEPERYAAQLDALLEQSA